MEALQPVFVLGIVAALFGGGLGRSIDNILGDPAEFPTAGNCKQSGAKLQHRLKNDRTRLVAARDGVWKPGPGYEDRMSPGESLILNSTNMNDAGLYELTCGPGEETRIHLNVVKASEVSVTVGDSFTLPLHYVTAGQPGKYYRLKRNGELVFELDLSSGKTSYPTGLEERVKVSPDWKSHGDLTLTFQGVHLEDRGDYFHYVQDKDETGPREALSAARLRVKNETNPDQTTVTPTPAPPTQSVPEEGMQAWCIVGKIAPVVVLVVAIASFLLGRYAKCDCSCNKCGSGGDGSDVHEPVPESEREPESPESQNDPGIPLKGTQSHRVWN